MSTDLVFQHLRVPVRTLPGSELTYISPADLPEDLRDVFFNAWLVGAACAPDGAYVHDFLDFMNRHGRGRTGDFSKIVEKYL